MTRRALTEGTTVLAFIRDFCGTHGYGPTMREIAAGCGLVSSSSAAYWVRKLEDDGLVTSQPGRARTLRPAREVSA